MILYHAHRFVVAASLGLSLHAFAAAPLSSDVALRQPNVVSRLSDVTQFGMPGDQKFIFCDAGDCADRTAKHLPPPVTAALHLPLNVPVSIPAQGDRIQPVNAPAPPTPAASKRKAIRKSVKKLPKNCVANK